MRRYIKALTLAVLALVLGLALVGVGPAFADDTQYFDNDGDGHADEWMSYNGYVYKIHIDENGYAVFDSCSNQDYVAIMDTVDPPGGTGGPPDLSDTGGGPVLPDSCYRQPVPSEPDSNLAGIIALAFIGGLGGFIYWVVKKSRVTPAH